MKFRCTWWRRHRGDGDMLHELGQQAVALVGAFLPLGGFRAVSARWTPSNGYRVTLAHPDRIEVTIELGDGVPLQYGDEQIAMHVTGTGGSAAASLRTPLTAPPEWHDYRPHLVVVDPADPAERRLAPPR